MKPFDDTKRVVAVVMACHFAASFAALGMPPFFAHILQRELHNDTPWLAGALYVLPTLLAALSAPWWGRLADRHGAKPLLLRAQLGLALSFLLASYASNTATFLMALVLQGVLGGTFAASNAYLATLYRGAALTRCLTAMQWSARAALVAAPLGIGWLLATQPPLQLYRWLALLPLLAALLQLWLPAQCLAGVPESQNDGGRAAAPLNAASICGLQAVFVLATVSTFPYFIADVQERFTTLSAAMAGLLFGLPHLAYLLLAPVLSVRWGRQPSLRLPAFAFALLALSLAGQWLTQNLPLLLGWRLLMGLAMTLGYIGLHALVACVARAGHAGRTLGWLESANKWGGVLAGVSAGLCAQWLGIRAPLLLGVLPLLLAAALLAHRQHQPQSRLSLWLSQRQQASSSS